jgi:putative SOS response-associated peptidase YedK
MQRIIDIDAMCANFEPPKPTQLEAIRKPAPSFQYAESYPGKIAPFLANGELSGWLPGCFGLVPHWAELSLARHTYNARVETVARLPSFRAAWKQRHLAVIPAMAIYEPNYETGKPIRWRIERADGKPFGIAGIWEHRFDDISPARWSFSMLTINADDHPLMKRFHAPEDEKRSVVLLDDDTWNDWLTAKNEAEIRGYLRLFDAQLMKASPAPRAKRPAKRQADSEGERD